MTKMHHLEVKNTLANTNTLANIMQFFLNCFNIYIVIHYISGEVQVKTKNQSK